ncbi:TRAP transporter large permease [Pseudooceanicola sp.]|uniref:TRAP transporter large permease n=1 Tax=Pseudooceanicola sp. TaxID=1914328 RepID=UPI00351565A8
MVDPALFSAFFVAALVIGGALGLHVALIMFGIGLITAAATLALPLILNIGNLAWETQNDFILVSVPLFLLMGEVLLRSGISERMYSAIAAWVDWLPGRLVHANIAASALFAATSGSSIATAATVGTVALPTFRQRGYDERLVLGSIAAGGTLGILIPPSINLIVYGAMTDTSVGRLFAAGVVPGLVLTLAFMALIAVQCLRRPEAAGHETQTLALARRIMLLLHLLPPAAIFALIMGSIYFGFATPTEAAALGVLFALAIAAAFGKLNLAMLHAAFRATVRTTGMVLLIVVAAFFLNFVLSVLGVPQAIARWIDGMNLTAMQTIWVLILLYLLLGCMLEALSLIVTTIPIVFPLVIGLGFDPVWLGIFLTLMAELALITPPVGMNLYVVQGIRGPGRGIGDVMVGVMPFVLILGLVTILVVYVPELALWLPEQLFK